MEGIDRKSISLRAADRGFEVCYEERYRPAGAGIYDNMCCRYKTEAFGEKELPKALKRFEELLGMSGEEE